MLISAQNIDIKIINHKKEVMIHTLQDGQEPSSETQRKLIEMFESQDRLYKKIKRFLIILLLCLATGAMATLAVVYWDSILNFVKDVCASIAADKGIIPTLVVGALAIGLILLIERKRKNKK